MDATPATRDALVSAVVALVATAPPGVIVPELRRLLHRLTEDEPVPEVLSRDNTSHRAATEPTPEPLRSVRAAHKPDDLAELRTIASEAGALLQEWTISVEAEEYAQLRIGP